MAPQPQTYFRDDSESPVKGILVIESGDEGVRVTENYEEFPWCKPFWMPEGEFTAHTHVDGVERAGLLTDEKAEEVIAVAESENL